MSTDPWQLLGTARTVLAVHAHPDDESLSTGALLAALALLPGTSARADGGAEADAPVRLVIATAGLTWEDIDAESTPTLQCLADRSGVGAMNTTSTTVVSTKRQGLETLHTGYRGLAEKAPRTSGIPTPPTDQWEQLPGEVTETDDPAAVAGALQDGDVVELIAPSVPDHDDSSREQALTELDGAVAAALEDFLRMEKWIFDSPDQAGEAFRQFVKQFYQGNGFVNGGVTIGDQEVHLGLVEMPVLNIFAEQDHLVPPDASRALRGLVGTQDYSELSFRGGHIGIYVSGRAQTQVPSAIHDWLAQRA